MFPAHWEEGTPVGDLMGTLKQISSLLLSSSAEELWPLILKIGKHKPHLPRSVPQSDNRRPRQNILGRFVADSAKEVACAAAAAVKPEIWQKLPQGQIVIHGTESYRVLLIVRHHGNKWHVLPGQIPRQGDEIKLWLRKCVPVAMNEAERARPNIRIVFADAMGEPVLAEPHVLLPMFDPATIASATSEVFFRATTLKVSQLLPPSPDHKRNLNVFVLHKLLREPKALEADMQPCFQRMAIAFMRNLKGLPVIGKDKKLLASVKTALEQFSKHAIKKIADEANAVLHVIDN